jgi:hypothetical protein
MRILEALLEGIEMFSGCTRHRYNLLFADSRATAFWEPPYDGAPVYNGR